MIWILVVIMTWIGTFASMLLKLATEKKCVFFSIYFYLGGMLYVCSACINIFLLKVLPFAVVAPLGSLSYIWTMLVANRLFQEKITRRKVLGILCIMAGVLLIGLARV